MLQEQHQATAKGSTVGSREVRKEAAEKFTLVKGVHETTKQTEKVR